MDLFAAGLQTDDIRKTVLPSDRTHNHLEIVEEKYFLGATQMNLGVVYQILGDAKSALTQFQRARSHFEEVGDVAHLSEAYYKLGSTFLATPSIIDAQRAFDMCYSLSVSTQNRTLTGLSFLGKARACFANRDLRMSLTLADQALNNLSIENDRAYVADVYRLKGTIHCQLNSVEFAHWYLYTSLKMYNDLDNAYNAGDCCFQIGILQVNQHRLSGAIEMFQDSVAFFRKGGGLAEAKLAQTELNKTKKLSA